MIDLREPPHNPDAELAIVGSGLVYGADAMAASDLRADELFVLSNGEAWAALRAHEAAGAPLDFVSVGKALKASGAAGRFLPSWSEWAVEVSQHACLPQQVPHFAGIIREAALARRLIELCAHVSASAYGGAAMDALLATARGGVADLEIAGATTETVHVSEAIRAALDDCDRRQRGEAVPLLMFGIGTLDSILGGCCGGQLVVVAARPAVGKSAFGGNVAQNLGMAGTPTAMFSVEMPAGQLAARWLARQTRISSHAIERTRIDVADWRKLIAAGGAHDQASLWLNDRASTLSQILGEARRWHAKHVCGRRFADGRPDPRACIVVDYLQRIAIERLNKGETREEAVGRAAREFKSLARSLNVTVVLLAQLNRAIEKRGGGDPILSDLRESGAIEQEADIILFLARDTDPRAQQAQQPARIIVAKHRGGAVGAAECVWLRETTEWRAAMEGE